MIIVYIFITLSTSLCVHVCVHVHMQAWVNEKVCEGEEWITSKNHLIIHIYSCFRFLQLLIEKAMKFYPKVAKLFIIFLHTGVFNFLAWWGKNSINFAFRNLVMQFLSEVR